MADRLSPTTLGLQPSFGFGDRLGTATPGHLHALQNDGDGIAGIFAQQSIREIPGPRKADSVGNMPQTAAMHLDHAPSKKAQTRINPQNTHAARAFVAFVTQLARTANKRQDVNRKSLILPLCRNSTSDVSQSATISQKRHGKRRIFP